MITDPVPEVQFRDEEAETHIVLHARHARRNDSVMHSDTLTLRLMSLSNAYSQQKLDFEKLLHEKGKRRKRSMQLDPGDVNQCFMRSPYRFKLDHRL